MVPDSVDRKSVDRTHFADIEQIHVLRAWLGKDDFVFPEGRVIANSGGGNCFWHAIAASPHVPEGYIWQTLKR
eukprot:6075927-Amphidinium_carterae.1